MDSKFLNCLIGVPSTENLTPKNIKGEQLVFIFVTHEEKALA